jgi:hypothetical protein
MHIISLSRSLVRYRKHRGGRASLPLTRQYLVLLEITHSLQKPFSANSKKIDCISAVQSTGYDCVKVLIIADETEAPAFDEIVGLRKAIQELVGKVDLLAFSRDSIFLNQKKISEKGYTNVGSTQTILAKKRYTLIIVSLASDNLRKLFFEKSNILQYLRNSPSRIRMYVSGASDIPDEIVTNRSVDLFPYSKQGAAKSTQKFKNAILDYIRKEQRQNQNSQATP